MLGAVHVLSHVVRTGLWNSALRVLFLPHVGQEKAHPEVKQHVPGHTGGQKMATKSSSLPHGLCFQPLLHAVSPVGPKEGWDGKRTEMGL